MIDDKTLFVHLLVINVFVTNNYLLQMYSLLDTNLVAQLLDIKQRKLWSEKDLK
jgi:hypothetical protein